METESLNQAFEPVWISTIAHAAEITAALERPSTLAQTLRRYPIGRGKPYLRYHWRPFSRLPVMPLASGLLVFGEGELRFRARPYLLPGATIHNLDTRCAFELRPEELLDLGPWRLRSPVANTFDLPCARIRTARPGLLGDFLACAGSTDGDMDGLREQSVLLYQALECFRGLAG